MIQIPSLQKIERSIKERRDEDASLVNWWLVILVLTPLTLGVYYIYVYLFKRTSRVNAFIVRKKAYYESILEFTEQYSSEKGSYDSIRTEVSDLKDLVNHRFSNEIKEINVLLTLLFSLLTLGIWCWVYQYKMNRIWNDLQKLEQDFDDSISKVWIKLGILKYPVNFALDRSKNRSYGLNLLLTIITGGLWYYVWDYKLHTDPDSLYKEFHSAEDTILQAARAA